MTNLTPFWFENNYITEIEFEHIIQLFFEFSYMTNLVENAPEGTILKFEGGLDMVEDLDKVSPSI